MIILADAALLRCVVDDHSVRSRLPLSAVLPCRSATARRAKENANVQAAKRHRDRRIEVEADCLTRPMEASRARDGAMRNRHSSAARPVELERHARSRFRSDAHRAAPRLPVERQSAGDDRPWPVTSALRHSSRTARAIGLDARRGVHVAEPAREQRDDLRGRHRRRRRGLRSWSVPVGGIASMSAHGDRAMRRARDRALQSLTLRRRSPLGAPLAIDPARPVKRWSRQRNGLAVRFRAHTEEANWSNDMCEAHQRQV